MKASLPSAGNTLTGATGINDDKNAAQKVTFFRKWQAGTSDMVFQIFVNGEHQKNISAGESFSVNIVTDEELKIEIKGYDKSSTGVKFSKGIALTDMDNPQVYLSLSEGLRHWEVNGLSPKLEVTVKGAKVWHWYEK
ncbi:MAG: hypothetical protein NC121_16690 [Blautia sp.]|nr:hypothetical protein [Blautia sp.]